MLRRKKKEDKKDVEMTSTGESVISPRAFMQEVEDIPVKFNPYKVRQLKALIISTIEEHNKKNVGFKNAPTTTAKIMDGSDEE